MAYECKASKLIQWIKGHVGDGYVYGTIGQICTINILKMLQIMYGKDMGEGYYQKDDNYTKGRCGKWIGKWVCDCSGLIKAARKALSGVWKDVSAQGTYDQCTKHGAINTMPLIPGCTVYMYCADKRRMGHVGMYIGGGTVIEARGASYGIVKTNLVDRTWSHWGLLDWLEYDINADSGKPEIGSTTQADVGDATNPKPDDTPTDPIKTTISHVFTDNAITSPSYWEKVLRGEVPCNPAWLKILLDNYHNQCVKAVKP